ncbi:acyltransferase [Brachybacterium sp. ACRRE]|uniref:acyltransferase n=1 Tax=Brachybacterium sp. ACRRE TaxID=2918184 RepID=UPI001EF38991|nr:acyltransferase [Brachybacterium sp. ACRRE]MCG7308160.1 acyltransferase [Brachybacterium sp. ACRRE]
MTSSAPSPAPPAPAREYLPLLDVLRITAILGVVLVHVVGGGVEAGTVGVGVTALDMAASAAVPVFLMMTGALNLHPAAHRHGPGAFWRRRAVRVVPALVVWSAVYMLLIDPLAGADISPGIALDEIITGRTAVHLYFLWAVLGLYAIAPVIAAFLHEHAAREGRRAWWSGILACGWTALAFAVPFLTAGPTAGGALDGLSPHRPLEAGALTYGLAFTGYFLIGRAAVVALPSRRTGTWLLALTPVCVLALTAVYEADRGGAGAGTGSLADAGIAVLGSGYTSPLVMAYATALFAGMTALALRWRVGPRAQHVLRTLGDATFGVFLAHFAILVLLRQLPWMGDGNELWQMAVAYVVVVPVSFAISLLAQRIPAVRLVF